MKRDLALLTATLLLTTTAWADPKLEMVARFYGPMPTGVAVSHEGRIFVNYPRWGDKVHFTVAELKNGKAVAYPSAKVAVWNKRDSANTLVAVQSVTMDSKDRLWILDTGSVKFTKPVAPKLVAVDLATNQVVKNIAFPPDVCLPTTYLNDVRFDLGRGPEGTAYITDSSDKGPNAIIVVDLATGHSWRRLQGHPSVKHEAKFVPSVEGDPLMVRKLHHKPAYVTWGCDGIALSPDGKTLYYCPLAGHHLYSVSTDALATASVSDADVAATVKDLGDRGFGSDGLICDTDGKLYLTDYEHRGVRVGRPEIGSFVDLVSDRRIDWPDSMAISQGYLYLTSNQLDRQKTYHDGKDLRKPPYTLFRIKLGVAPSQPK